MLVIGHRGAAGLAPENTLESLRAGVKAGADMLEFDVRLTADKVPILAHDAHLKGLTIRRSTLAQLRQAGTVTTLQSVLDEFLGRILLNLEFKPIRGTEVLYNFITERYVEHPSDWNNLLVSSFHVRSLLQFRRLNPMINLALLHGLNPLAFVTHNRRLQLSAVGWHRLHVNSLTIAIAQKAGIFTYVYTINRPQAALALGRKGIDAIVTDYPDRIAGKFRPGS